MSTTELALSVAAADRGASSLSVVAAGDPAYEEACRAFNLAVQQRPAAVAVPADAEAVAVAVAYARTHGLQVAPQATGHNAGPLGDLSGVLLLKTNRMTGVTIDPVARIARANAGARWEELIEPASALGLAALHGSSPDVGIVGYTLGGGMGWLARKHGLASNHVTAIELVTADGEHVRATHDEESELFWGLRGGGGNFGVVTAIEFRLFPVTEIAAGALFFPWERAAEVLQAWQALLPGLPDAATSVARILQVPSLAGIPEPLRGRGFAVVEAAYLGTRAGGEALLAPLRALGPELDTFAMVPPSELAGLHMDPRDPLPVASTHRLLTLLPEDALDALVAACGPGSGSPLASVELRHTGGALARSADHHGARDTLPGELSLFAVGVPADADTAAAIDATLARVLETVAPHVAGSSLNFVEQACDAAASFDPATWERLCALKATRDPDARFRANHPIAG